MRTAVMIIVRMKSQRLPEKAVKIISGKTMIEHLIERMKSAKLPDEIIVCTSTNKQDDILEKLAEKSGVKCVRGSEDDVLKRMLSAAKKYNIDFIVNTTGDNPLTNEEYVDKTIEEFEKSNADYITSLKLPLGTFCYGIKVNALEKVVELKKENDTEIWGSYFKTRMFKHVELEVPEELNHPEMRLTVDTEEDFKLIKNIFSHFYTKDKNFRLNDLIKYLKDNPHILKINKNIVQRKSPDVDLSRFKN